jgi:hypothetical protein
MTVIQAIEKRIAGNLRLDRLLDQSGPQAPRAYADPQGIAIDERPHPLQIGTEYSLGLVVGVTDIMTGLVPFATDITYKSHGKSPSICSCNSVTRGMLSQAFG